MSQSTTIPILKDSEQQLDTLRERLQHMFRSLNLIHDVALICGRACDAVRSETDAEMSHILRMCCSNPLYGVLEELAAVVKQLGGQTELSDDNDDEEVQLEDANEQE